MQTQKQPKTIFEQIVLAQEITNENVLALADNLAVVNAKIDALLEIFSPAGQESSEPDASGAEKGKQ